MFTLAEVARTRHEEGEPAAGSRGKGSVKPYVSRLVEQAHHSFIKLHWLDSGAERYQLHYGFTLV